MPAFLDVTKLPGGKTAKLRFNFHDGQKSAMNSKKRIVLILAGARSGKTTSGPPWLFREMKRRGAGDYLVATPTYPILDKAAAPEIDRVFNHTLGLGKIKGKPFSFEVSKEGEGRLWGKYQDRKTRIIFGHADDPDSLEAMTAKAAWLDEAGQGAFKLGSWEAIQRRLAVDQGRVLLTTTPYIWNWLKTKLYDPWMAAKRDHPEIDVFQFDSTWNPAFPPAEYERARRDLPSWKFNMFFRGLFERPAGQIYDCFDEKMMVCPPFSIPVEWPRYLGLDFGGVNTAAVSLAGECGQDGVENGNLVLYREYLKGGRTAKEHAAAWLSDEAKMPFAVGGSKSEDQWRDEFAAAGLPVRNANVKEVEVGIGRVYGAIKRGELKVCSDCEGILEELRCYARELDANGEPTEKIEAKETYHRLDALRYLLSYLKGDPVDVHKMMDELVATEVATAKVAESLPISEEGGIQYHPSFQEWYVFTAKDGVKRWVFNSPVEDEARYAAGVLGVGPVVSGDVGEERRAAIKEAIKGKP